MLSKPDSVHGGPLAMDLPECIKSAVPFIFADNIKCLIAVRYTTDTEKLKEDIINAADWSHFTNLLFISKIFPYSFSTKTIKTLQSTLLMAILLNHLTT